MSEELKEFYGKVSLAASVSFSIKAKDEEEAENIIFEEIEGIQVVLKDGSTIEIAEINWDLINEASRGNVGQSYIDDFEIQQEKE